MVRTQLFGVWFYNFFPSTKLIKTQYISDFSKRRLFKEYLGRKVNNAPGVNSGRNFALVRTPSFSPRVIAWLEPAVKTKTSTWPGMGTRFSNTASPIIRSAGAGHPKLWKKVYKSLL